MQAVEENIFTAMLEGQRSLERQCCALADVLRAADILLHVANPAAASPDAESTSSTAHSGKKRCKSSQRQLEEAPSARPTNSSGSSTPQGATPPQDILFQARSSLLVTTDSVLQCC
jgi:hypothetical protein